MRSGIAFVAASLTLASSALADKPLLIQSCTRSTLCSAAVVQFEEASDYPRRPLFLEPEGANVSPVGAGSQKLNNYAVQFTGSNFLWAPSGGAFGNWFTIAVWIYPTAAGSSGQTLTLLSEDGDNVPGNTLELYNASGAGVAPRVTIRDGIDPKNGAIITATWGSNLSLNTWHLVIARMRPKTFIANGELSIQVDNGTPVTTPVGVETWTGGGRLFAGKKNIRGSESYFTGYMDQLAIDGARWTDQETGLYWNSGAGLQWPFITGDTAYSTPTSQWRLDRVSSTSGALKDDAAGGNDGSIVSGVALGTGGPFGYSADFTAGYASVSASIVDPLSLSPTLWLKADTLSGLSDGDPVATWPDQSGNGNDAVQATASLKPTYKTGILNGKAVVRFDGSSDQMNTSLNAPITSTAGTYFVVSKHSAGAGSEYLVRIGTTTAPYAALRMTSTGTSLDGVNYDGTTDVASKSGRASGTWYINMWQHDSGNVCASSSDARDSGRACTASGNTFSLSAAIIGADSVSGNPANWWNGDMAEILIFNTALSENDRKSIELYLSDKYAITVPYASTASSNSNLKTDGRAFSIEGWFKVSSTAANQGLVASRDVSNGWEVHFHQPTGKLQFKWGDGTTNVTLDDTTAISAGTWYYFVARYDGANTFKVSLNGNTGGATTSTTHPSNAGYFYFGTTDNGTSDKLTGSLSSVSWHKGLYLSDAEVTAHYNSGNGRECCPIK